MSDESVGDELERTRAENVLLRAALHQAQWTVGFLHGCLTNPDNGRMRGGYKYAHPEQTLTRLEEWRALAPPPELCVHSKYREGCPACESGRRWRADVAAARAVIAGTTGGNHVG